jgi:C1A family cysteine protease
MSKFIPSGLGWHPDLPDPRDRTPQDEGIRRLLRKARARRRRGPCPPRTDWREYCAPVAEQQSLQSCTAYACVGLFQYFERRAKGKMRDSSPLFLYKSARRLLDWPGDRGATLRSTLKAMVRFGIPPERFWNHSLADFDDEPKAFLYSFAREFRALSYFRLDPPVAPGAQNLETVKAYLAAGFPSLFGFSVFNSLTHDADIPAPTVFDSILGGQAVVAVGYDDERRIRSTRGALLIRSSWGTTWGEGGYGWLPYAYVCDRLALEFWTLLKSDWLESGEFDQPASR